MEGTNKRSTQPEEIDQAVSQRPSSCEQASTTPHIRYSLGVTEKQKKAREQNNASCRKSRAKRKDRMEIAFLKLAQAEKLYEDQRLEIMRLRQENTTLQHRLELMLALQQDRSLTGISVAFPQRMPVLQGQCDHVNAGLASNRLMDAGEAMGGPIWLQQNWGGERIQKVSPVVYQNQALDLPVLNALQYSRNQQPPPPESIFTPMATQNRMPQNLANAYFQPTQPRLKPNAHTFVPFHTPTDSTPQDTLPLPPLSEYNLGDNIYIGPLFEDFVRQHQASNGMQGLSMTSQNDL